MKRLEKRAIICLTLAAVLFLGLCVFVARYVSHGHEWATFYGNKSIYTNGKLNIGRIYDINGIVLADNSDQNLIYSTDPDVRLATVHTVGDMAGNISTGAERIYRDKLVGYNILTGTYSLTGKGNDITLTIDQDICKEAYRALEGREGTVGVYNYETGEIICMVSTPTFDPANPPTDPNNVASGSYINKFLSAKIVPGSIFKLVTSAAAIENLSEEELNSWHYSCHGSTYINGEKITCVGVHGYVDFRGALAKSCNCGFADLTQKIGAENMKKYVEKLGLTANYEIDGMTSKAGSFEFPTTPFNLAWSGIGQYKDLVNPCSMMVYMGAIANGGNAATPKIIHKALSKPDDTGQIIKKSTAEKLTEMMKNNVKVSYYESNFPGLDIYAKSGTAEVANKTPNAWFTGFIKNPDKPYAFIVCVENGGSGAAVAGPVANRVLQAIVNGDK